MSRDVRELYQQIILEHNKKPRNFGPLDAPTHEAKGHNPLCGDKIDVALVLKEGKVEAIKFQGSGCAISQASTSMMTVNVKGKTLEEALQMVEEFRAMVRGELDLSQPHHLGHLVAFQGVKDLPVRVKCAVLPWATLHSALEGKDMANTEGE